MSTSGRDDRLVGPGRGCGRPAAVTNPSSRRSAGGATCPREVSSAYGLAEPPHDLRVAGSGLGHRDSRYDVSVNIVFLGGADLDPPPPQGESDRSRYLKVRSWDEMNKTQVQEWVRQAGSVPGWS